MVYKYVEDLREHRVFYHFLEISKIPRQIFFEKEISDFILKICQIMLVEEISSVLFFYKVALRIWKI